MITVTCTEKLRDKNNRIVGYELQDCNGKKMRFTSEQVKQAVFLQQITVTNLKLTSDGRLVKYSEKPKTKVRTNKKVDNNKETLESKIKNMSCYEIAQIKAYNIAKIIERLSSIRLESLDLVLQPDESFRFYYSGCMPFIIMSGSFEDCPFCIYNAHELTVNEQLDYCKHNCINRGNVTQIYKEIMVPIKSKKYYSSNNYSEGKLCAYTGEQLVKLCSMWNNIPDAKISYGDMTHGIYSILDQYIQKLPEVYSRELYITTDVLERYTSEVATLNFDIKYKDGTQYVIVATIVLYLSDDEYNIQIIGDKKDNYFSTTVSFKDDAQSIEKIVKPLGVILNNRINHTLGRNMVYKLPN